MALHVTRLGPYEILSSLGSGGMGEVYRARDTRLGRDVALKILPAELAAHPERLQRFEREARAVSALNHPNIVVLHDVGRDEGIDFLVMELVEGETLSVRLARGPIPIHQVLRWGAQISSALDASHRKGILHRDLKPGNIMVTPSGVKLLDFGLARALEAEPAEDPSGASAAVTVSSPVGPLTSAGMVMGTLPYMAPEQLHGGPVDARCDLFALGAVLFECTTRRRAFEGDTNGAVVRAVLSVDPPPASSLEPECPRSLERLIRVCLEKDPEQRYRSAHDVALQLSAIDEDSAMSPVDAPLARRRPTYWIMAALALLSAGLLTLVVRSSMLTRPTGGTVRFQIAPPPGGLFVHHVEGPAMAMSPDGSRVAFIASDEDTTRRIWMRRMDELELKPVDGTEGASSLFWSFDGRSIGFFTAEQLKRVDVTTQAPVAPVTIVTLGPGPGRIGTWGATDILFSSIQGEAILRVPPDGGVPEVMLRPDPTRRETRANWPWFLPDGTSFLYSLKTDDGQIRLTLSRAGEAPRDVATLNSQAQFVPPDFLVYVTEGVLVAQRFDPGRGRLEGSPYPIAPVVRYFQSNGWAAFATSLSGALVYRSEADVMRLVWVDRTGNELGTIGGPGEYLNLALSEDGGRLLYDDVREGLGTWDVWSLDIDRGTETRLTSNPDTDAGPRWMPSQKAMVYFAVTGSLPQLVRRDLATGTDESLLSRPGFQVPMDISPDGSTLLFSERTDEGTKLWTLSFDSDRPSSSVTPFPLTMESPVSARFSPDGRWIAYVSHDSGRFEAYVVASDGSGEKIKVSSEGTSILRWGQGGSELLYMTLDGRMLSVPVNASGGSERELGLGTSSVLFRLPKGTVWSTFEVSPDGRFLAADIESRGNERPATVVLNWPSLISE